MVSNTALERAMQLAMNLAHVYSFVGDDSMPRAKKELEDYLRTVISEQPSTASMPAEKELDINVLRSPITGRFPIDIEMKIREKIDPVFATKMENARAELRAEQQAALQLRQVPQWLPIESAPKDGQYILLWIRHKNADYATDAVKEGWVTAVLANWLNHNGGGYSWQGLCGTPTHWMPLPTAPLNQIAQDDK